MQLLVRNVTSALIEWHFGNIEFHLPIGLPFSRVTFKAQLKVGWQPKYYIECYIPKC